MAEPVKIEILMVDKMSGAMDKSQRKVKELRQHVSGTNKELEDTDRITGRLSRSIGKLAGAFAIKELVSNVVKVRGEFQQLEVAFGTMLQSAEKADALMQQLTKTAATTPFGLEDVAQGAKQLLAYGLEAEKVNETLIRLGDIAAGLSVPLNDLVYLYGTTMAQGRLYTQDLNQFTGRGIPMINELAKQFGVAESKVKELVESGKVGFPEVQKVIESLTNEGGKFGGLMEEQSKTITGQISNIEDSLSMMMNELGEQNEGIINTTLSGISYVIEHYERMGRVLLGLEATYGTYRTAIMLETAAKGWATAAEALHYNWLLLVEKAQKMLNATMLANPYVLVATLIAGVVAAMVSMKSEAELLQEADEAYEEQKQKVIEAEEEHKRMLEEPCQIAGDEALSTDTRREALNRARKLQEETNANYLSIAQAQAGYHNNHHSFNYYWGGFSQEQIDRLSEQIGRQWDGSLWSLSPEEMKMLRSNVDMWEQILTTGKGGYGGMVAEKLNDYIDQAGKLEEITDALYENLTTTTKDNVFDDFLNSLYDLADGSEDVMDEIADNWQKMVNRMVVNNLVGAKFQERLEGWYEELAKLNEARVNGEITDAEYRKRLDELKAEYEGYVESAENELDMLREEGIIQSTGANGGVSQSGKAGAFTTMSQEQAGKLEGLFVSGQIHWSSIDDKMTDVSVQIGAAGDTLKKIEEHTGSSAQSLDDIRNDIKIIKRDGLKMK